MADRGGGIMHDHGAEHDVLDQSPDHIPHWIFKLGIFLNVLFFFGDLFVVLYFSRSAAILGDSLHNGLHALAHTFALHGHGLEENSPDKEESYESKLHKYKAAQRIGYVIIIGALFIAVFGCMQIYNPKEVESSWMILVASLDIVSNAVLLKLLLPYRKDPTAKPVFTDIMIDTLASIGVSTSGIVILFTSYYRADGIAAIPIALIALYLGRKTILEARHGIQNLHRHKDPH